MDTDIHGWKVRYGSKELAIDIHHRASVFIRGYICAARRAKWTVVTLQSAMDRSLPPIFAP